ncbi:MAG TPA: zf-HC2 domain-containing protein [Vicinamibacterales bacterium]|nr:zf-HC2 domain-containing protein [Vicinamibacterales bacterium]
MTGLTCSAVRRRLAEFYDSELPVQKRIEIQGHLNGCEACVDELQSYEQVSSALRFAAVAGPADDWTGLRPGVISRMRAEANEAWPARLARTFDDMHLVWIGLASTAATFVCGAVVLGMLHYASPEREDSLRALIAVMAAPSGSNLNPASMDGLMIQAPSVPEEGIVKASLERSGAQGELMLAFAAVITREGNISGLEALGEGRGRLQAAQLINEISRGRLEPARYGTDPIAVNLVWLVEHLTVKPKSSRVVGS